jgi:hypothetical protein
MNPLHSNGQLDSDIFKDENEQSVKLKFNEENNCWFGNYSLIRFGQHQLTEAEFLIDNDTAHFSANALLKACSIDALNQNSMLFEIKFTEKKNKIMVGTSDTPKKAKTIFVLSFDPIFLMRRSYINFAALRKPI